ncbi:MAG: DUF2237 domain-containing protein [Halofilum sp. (in: g-proteobacteria)]|nr:DUF2237 domain-containing protein [Halofilum sp. (in: g-proteobacteria)]
MKPFAARNVYGKKLETCGHDPVTGFYRDGCCNTGNDDHGIHTVCARVTEEFLAFSKRRGNDLTAPSPATGFRGLKAGDHWCLCAGRWLDAHKAGCAPGVYLRATHEETLAIIPLEVLEQYALDQPASH